MTNLWSDDEAAATVAHYGAQGIGEDRALRTYTARLLGREPALVMHGGGNTSVKTRAMDLFGHEVEVICVKGSGWDLATIEPPGHPAVRLEPLRALRGLGALSDEAMVNVQRQNLMESSAPNPSVETLLHAFLPQKFVDHTHSVAVCAIADQRKAERLCEEVWGRRVGLVPYIMPGFALAKAAAEVFEARPEVEGLILLKHGIFSFGDTARESYERMIDLVAAAELFIASRDARLARIAIPTPRRAPLPSPLWGGVGGGGGAEPGGPGAAAPSRTAAPRPGPPPPSPSPQGGGGGDVALFAERASAAPETLPALRGALLRAAETAGAPGRWLLDRRISPEIARVLGHPRLDELALRGVSTPDHVIRTKGAPVVLPAPPPEGPLDDWLATVEARIAAFGDDYRGYFARNDARAPGMRKMLDPLPRLAAITGIGLVGIGKSAAEAAVAADLGEAWAATLLRAEAVGRFEPVGEADLFDLEYWSLEQAKLGKGAEKRLARHVVAVTGAAGAIGAAVARAFAAEGAEVALLDLDGAAAERLAASISPMALGLGCDVTDRAAVDAAFEQVALRFGGVDIVVSNAGAAWTGAVADLDDATLRRSFELNFFAHQSVAQAAVKVMRLQRMGGAMLFNVSKQAVNPGRDFGAYGLSKAALLALVRQYALEHGRDGIRANAINADRIRSGLLTDEMIAARAGARGLSEADYMAGNLLGREVRAEDVAQAFVAAALMERSTGAVITVDGGAVEAMMR